MLRGGDRGVRVLDALRAGVDFTLRGGGVVARRLHVDDRLVDALLLGLDGGAEVLQFLVDVGDGGDEGPEAVRAAGLRDGQTRSGEQHAGDKGNRADPPVQPRSRGARGASHWTRSPMAQRERAGTFVGCLCTEVT